MVSLQAALLALAVTGSGTGDTMLLDFYADWCGPCRQMNPTVEQLIAKGYPVKRVNVDQHRALAAQYRIGPIPCFVMVVDGKEVAREIGCTSLARLEQMCRMGTAVSASGMLAQNAGPPALSTAGGQPIPVHGETATQEAPDGGKTVSPSELLSYSVRIRIEDADGHSCGSGTIIDARQGRALILTCGHIFRDSGGKGRIEVDLFGENAAQKVPGRLIAYDEKRDVGLVSIEAPGPIVAARVAPRGYQVRKGDRAFSVGCNHGADPTVRPTHIAALDRYLGPPNLQVDDQPVEGRSGGGLFTPDGLVIGVCNAADPTDHEGLFAALGAIHDQLDEARLAFVYEDVPSTPDRMVRPDPTAIAAAEPEAPAATATSVAPLAPATSGPPAEPPVELVRPPASSRTDATAEVASEQLRPDEQAALEELRRRTARGAEVICIIRPTGDPAAKSEILVINEASPALLEQLAGGRATESRGGELTPTSLAVPRQPRPMAPIADGPQFEPPARSGRVRLPSPLADSPRPRGLLYR